MTKLLLSVAVCFALTEPIAGQNIKGHYVAKTETDGTIYHTFPSTLFENRQTGDLIFDITYKSNADNQAVINFTYEMGTVTPVDSVRFVCGTTRMDSAATKLYISAEKKGWKHRYTFFADLKSLCTFFDAATMPTVVLYSHGQTYVYKAKESAWRNYAPVGHKIFEMIRMNERQ